MKGTSNARKHALEEGSVFQDSRGNWVAMLSCGYTARGTRKRIRRVRSTEKEARKALLELRVQMFSGVMPDDERMTLGAWLDKWLSNHWDGSERTRAFYRGHITHWLKPELGSRLLSKLTPGEIEGLTRKVRESGKERTALGVYQTLRKALKDAERLGLLSVNPVGRTRPPKAPARKEEFLGTEEIERLLGSLKDLPIEVSAVISVGICTGLRLGELLGVTWSSLDMADSSILVFQQLQKVKGGFSLAPLKTRRSQRTVFLDPRAKSEALRLKEWQERLGHSSDLGLVFLNPYGRPWHQSNLNDELKKACVRAGVKPLSAHKLFRHTYATRLLKKGASLHDTSRILGHASTVLTGDLYGHHEREATRRAQRLAWEEGGNEGRS